MLYVICCLLSDIGGVVGAFGIGGGTRGGEGGGGEEVAVEQMVFLAWLVEKEE